MEKQIFLRDALKQMKTLDVNGRRNSFDIECRTFNDYNKSGGNYRVYKNVKILIAEKLNGDPFDPAKHFYRKYRKRVNPNHWENFTINIELENGQVISVKSKYIIKFNGKEVVY